MKKVFLCTFTLCSFFAKAQVLDSTYHAIGYSAGQSWPQANKIFQLPDGKTVQAVNEHNGVTLSKFLEDGTPDLSFGPYGRQIMSVGACVTFAPISNVVEDLAVQTDGMYVGVGHATYSYGGACGFENMDMFRFRADGTADSTFGTCGIMEAGSIISSYPLNLTYSHLTHINLLPGGQMLVSGFGQAGSATVYNIFIKMNHDGTLDPTFGDNGIYTLPTTLFNNVYGNNPNSVYVDAAGSIYALGNTLNMALSGYHPYGQVVKLLPTGAMDYSFGDSGVVNLAYGTNNSLTAIHPRTDGKLAVLGTYGTNATMTILNTNGSVDSSIIAAGYATIPDPGYASNLATAFYLQDDNKPVLCGYGLNGYSACAYIARLNEDGTYDASFNGTGIDTFNYGVYTHWQSGTFLNDIKLVCGNRILAAGGINQSLANANQGTFIVKLRMDDTSNCTYILPTATNNLSKQGTAINIYPNPANEEITVGNAAPNTTYSLMSLTGQKLLTGTLDNATQTISLKGIAQGNYIIQLIDATGNKSFRKITKL